MSQIVFKLTIEEKEILKKYSLSKGLTISDFIRESVFNKIEEEEMIAEKKLLNCINKERLLNSLKKTKKEKRTNHTLQFSKNALEQLAKLDIQTHKKVLSKLTNKFFNNDNPFTHGRFFDGKLKNVLIYQVDDYRAFIEYFDNIYFVFEIVQKNEIYDLQNKQKG